MVGQLWEEVALGRSTGLGQHHHAIFRPQSLENVCKNFGENV